MFLASDSSHKPLAVFDNFASAEAYLCFLGQISIRFSCIDDLDSTKTITKVYVENPDKILGYITAGIAINPKFYVR